MNSGRAAARARMAEDSSLESHTVTNWRVCRREWGLDRERWIREVEMSYTVSIR